REREREREREMCLSRERILSGSNVMISITSEPSWSWTKGLWRSSFLLEDTAALFVAAMSRGKGLFKTRD
ncbi:MAG: hypothetical protein LBP92_12180, partial [Deltaproteobacteria bacterium]|nr:hypothetical protein [Deltaproteobacteria bacterium]